MILMILLWLYFDLLQHFFKVDLLLNWTWSFDEITQLLSSKTMKDKASNRFYFI